MMILLVLYAGEALTLKRKSNDFKHNYVDTIALYNHDLFI